MEPWNSFSDFIRHISTHYSQAHCLNGLEEGKWHSYSTEEVLKEVRHLSLGLVARGLTKGTCVGLIALPSPRWTMVSMAVMVAGGVFVPLFPNVSDENFIFEIKQTGTHWIFVDRMLSIPIFEQHQGLFTDVFDLKGDSYSELLELGEELDGKEPHKYQELCDALHPEDLASIIYTSGSTGQPKGAELTQRNILAHLTQHPWDLYPDKERYLSILPLAHIFGFTVNYLMLGFGVSIYYSNDIKSLGKVCQELHPTAMIVVPRLLEKLYAKMLSKVHEAGFIKRHIGQWAFDLANSEENNLIKHLAHPLVDKLVYHTLRNALGGSLRIVVSGGAPLNPHLNHFYQEIGVPIVEGWGMTEGCPITVNPPGKNKIGTVGVPLKGIDLKISPEGEVLVKGSLVMRGYYHNPELTAQFLDADGWLHTGDKGEIDAEGYLTLHGRLKELFKTSTGEYVAPVPIEQLICKAPLIEMAMVIAEGRQFASCLLFPNKEVMESLKVSQKMENLSDEEFLKSSFVKGEMERLFAGLNSHLNHWEQVRAYRFVSHPPSIEAGELTPTLKIRRNEVTKRYEQLINSMYLNEVNV